MQHYYQLQNYQISTCESVQEVCRQKQQKDEEEKEEPLPAAQACGLTATWLAEEGTRAGWSPPSAPGTNVLNLALGSETCWPLTGSAEPIEEQQRDREGEERKGIKRREE